MRPIRAVGGVCILALGVWGCGDGDGKSGDASAAGEGGVDVRPTLDVPPSPPGLDVARDTVGSEAPDGPRPTTEAGAEAVEAPREAGVDVPDANPDAAPFAAVTGLTATVKDRRQTTLNLAWQVPANVGTGLAVYEIRAQKMAVGATDCSAFNPATAEAVPFPRSPGAAGSMESFDIAGRLIETSYCFRVIGRDRNGTSTMSAVTAVPVRAKFNVAILNPQAPAAGDMMNERFGFFVDGSGTVDGDNLSDVVVGSVNNNRAYIFLGSATFNPTAPSVVIQGTSPGFGSGVAQIGSFDGDGLPEIAIGARTSNKVFIYKGRQTWPATLTEAQADYEVNVDMTAEPAYAGSSFGIRIARVGNFDGDADATDDVAISATNYPFDAATMTNLRRGRVVIVKGAKDMRPAGMSKTTITLPNPGRSMVIDGDAALMQPSLGSSMAGIGRYYADGPGTTLVVAAQGFLPASSGGRVYAYRMTAAGMVTAPHNVVLGMEGASFGTMVANLGVLTGTLPSVGIGNNLDKATSPGAVGTAFVMSGDATAGPFMSRSALFNPGVDNIGQLVFAGGLPGTTMSASVFGDSKPDIGVAGIAGGSPTVYLISGATMLGTTPINIEAMADIKVPLPAGWTGTASGSGGLVRDINGDGFADFAAADANSTMTPGRVAVFW